MGETRRNLAITLHELEAGGCPTLMDEGLDLGPQLKVSQVGGVAESVLFDNKFGLGCVMDLEIVNELPIPLYVRNIELQLPWGPDRFFRWFSDIDLLKNRYHHFRGTALQYAREDTLNDWFAGNGRIAARDRKAGVLLGVGGPIPNGYKHGMLAHVELVVTDHLDCSWPFRLQLWVDRTERMSAQKRTQKSHAGLYEPVTEIQLQEQVETSSIGDIERSHRAIERGVTAAAEKVPLRTR